jgi:hypothetical protein
MQRHLLAAAAADRVVLVGRGANFLLGGVPTALRVRVTAPKAARIERIQRREHADRDAVKRLIEETDRERAGFIRAVYHRSWDDPEGYDRAFDTGLTEPEQVVGALTDLLAERDRADRAAAGRVLAGRLAAADVRVALFTDPRLQLPLLEVAGEGDAIAVTGVVHGAAERRLVEKLARGGAGVRPLRFDLRLR